ncbi:biotin transporter BioY [Tistrella mobilis]|uniref:Biotin transporter n=1 Tax=Tistrella mobilis TaxID=171437 RepID=A0A161R4L6_9PROT|nr:biotin transporter BioY [Tistrella mobilis]KYO53386.1 BioY family transporter [Tistrella mobilis]
MRARDVFHILFFTALTAVLGLFPPLDVPLMGVPITAQTLGVMLSGLVLGSWRAALAQMVFVALVMAGIPLLAGGRGGMGILTGPTGGFLIGWIPAAFVIGLLAEAGRPGWLRFILATITGGIGVVYLIGVPWAAMVTTLSPWQVLTGSMAFLPGDLIKAVTAAAIAVTLRDRGRSTAISFRR